VTSPGSLELFVDLFPFPIRFKTDKQTLKPPEETAKDAMIDGNNGSAAAIIKSASTPASLQTIVRFSNGSNMSLQHKVGEQANTITFFFAINHDWI